MFLEIINENETFELPIDDSVLILRRMDRETLKRFRKQNTKNRTEFVNHQRVTRQEVDEEGLNDDLIDYVIVDWKNVKDSVTKKDVECSRENKMKLAGDAMTRILDICNATSTVWEGSEDGDSKNSLSSSPSGKTAPA